MIPRIASHLCYFEKAYSNDSGERGVLYVTDVNESGYLYNLD